MRYIHRLRAWLLACRVVLVLALPVPPAWLDWLAKWLVRGAIIAVVILISYSLQGRS